MLCRSSWSQGPGPWMELAVGRRWTCTNYCHPHWFGFCDKGGGVIISLWIFICGVCFYIFLEFAVSSMSRKITATSIMLEESACVLWGWNELHKENKYVKNVRWTCWQEQEDWRESRGAVQLVQLQVAQTPLSGHRCYGLEAWRPLRPRILHIKEAASVVEQAWWQELSHATTCSGAGNPSALQCLRCNEHHQHPCLILQDWWIAVRW